MEIKKIPQQHVKLEVSLTQSDLETINEERWKVSDLIGGNFGSVAATLCILLYQILETANANSSRPAQLKQ